MYLQFPLVLFLRHHHLTEGPIMGNVHVCIFCIRIDLPFYLKDWQNFRFWTLIAYIQIIVCCVFAFSSVWLVLLLRVLFRLFCTFLLCPSWLWADNDIIYWLGLLLLLQRILLWQRASMPTYDNDVITTMVYVGQPIAFIQHYGFVSVMGQMLALLNEWSLIWFHLQLPHSVVSRTLRSFRSMGLIN